MKRTAALPLALASLLLPLLLSGCALPPQQDSADRPSTCGVSPDQLERLRSINAMVVARGFAPGITTQLFCQGQPILVQTNGHADLARKRALLADDLFRIYSMTKPLTSVAAMILVDDKRLALDDPIAKYLPEFATARVFASGDTPETLTTTPPSRLPTVRDLLRHTAGLTYPSAAPGAVNRLYVLRGIDHGGGARVTPADQSPAVANIGEFTQRLASIPLLHEPGERFTYGNATEVLAAVVEKAAGQRYRDFLHARVLKPLKMEDSFFDVPTDKIERLTAAYAGKSSEAAVGNVLRSTRIAELGEGRVGQVEDPKASIFAKPRYIDFGGAGLVSTARDYQRFLQMLQNDGVSDGVRILSPGVVAEMTRNHLSPSALATPGLAAQGLGFGLGFARFLNPQKAPAAVPKNGYFWGGAASTYFWVDPDRRLSGVVMTQVFGGDVMPFYLEMLNTLYAETTTGAKVNRPPDRPTATTRP